MKILIILLFCSLSLYSQNPKIPQLKGKTPNIDTIYSDNDTIYIINKAGIDNYMECVKAYNSLRSQYKILDTLIYTIEGVEMHIYNIQKNVNAMYIEIQKNTNENITAVSKLIDSNRKVQESLKEAYKEQKRSKFKDLLGNNIGSILLGILLIILL